VHGLDDLTHPGSDRLAFVFDERVTRVAGALAARGDHVITELPRNAAGKVLKR
jgi:hypothetical protein